MSKASTVGCATSASTSTGSPACVIETWRREYNEERPKNALGGLTLAAASGGTRSKEGAFGAVMLGAVGLGMLVTGALGWLAAAVLDAATGREMEFLADSDAVRMLSDSVGLVGALVKLGQEANEFPPEASGWLRASNPMFFNVAAKRYWFDTHPPLLELIRALDPAQAAELQTLMGG